MLCHVPSGSLGVVVDKEPVSLRSLTNAPKLQSCAPAWSGLSSYEQLIDSLLVRV